MSSDTTPAVLVELQRLQNRADSFATERMPMHRSIYVRDVPRLIAALRLAYEALEWYRTAAPQTTDTDYITPLPAMKALTAIAQALGMEPADDHQ